MSLRSVSRSIAVAFGCGLVAWAIPVALDLRNDAFVVGLVATTLAVGFLASALLARRGVAVRRAVPGGLALVLGGAALIWIAMFVLLVLGGTLGGGDLDMS